MILAMELVSVLTVFALAMFMAIVQLGWYITVVLITTAILSVFLTVFLSKLNKQKT